MADIPDEDQSVAPSTGGRLVLGPGVTVRMLEIFVAVARFSTMSAAAQHLGLTQPAVSQAVQQLEFSLELQLFDRSKRPPRLTLQGATLLEPAEAVLGAIGRFEDALRWGSATRLPMLRIGMLNSFAETMGPLMLAGLRSVAAQLIVDSAYPATRGRAVADRKFDFVFTTDESPPLPGIEITPILTEPFLVVVPSSYSGDPQAVSEVSEAMDLIQFGRDPYVISRLTETLQSFGIVSTHRFQMDTHEAVLQMVAAGAGWTILPPLAVYRAMARGDRLRIAPYPDPGMTRRIMLFSRAGEAPHVVTHLHAAAIEALRSAFLPTVTALMPGVAELVTLHGVSALDGQV